MPDVHALLSASSSKQWLHCPPSVRLQEGFPNESSVYAEEGTFAHEVCEYKVRKYLHERVKRPQSEEFYTEEIDQITDVPIEAACKTLRSITVAVEQKVHAQSRLMQLLQIRILPFQRFPFHYTLFKGQGIAPVGYARPGKINLFDRFTLFDDRVDETVILTKLVTNEKRRHLATFFLGPRICRAWSMYTAMSKTRPLNSIWK